MLLFISYAHDDGAYVREIEEKLGKWTTHRFWYDTFIKGGHHWWNAILDSIEQCDCFLTILTPRSVRSVFCTTELDYALELGKPILPLILHTCDYPQKLAEIQYIDVTSLTLEEALVRTLHAIHSIEMDIFKGIYRPQSGVPRPPMPEPVRPEHVYEMYDTALQALAEGREEYAEPLLEKVAKANLNQELTQTVNERLAEIRWHRLQQNAYEQMLKSMTDLSSFDEQALLWARFVNKYGRNYDPKGLNARFEFETTTARRVVSAKSYKQYTDDLITCLSDTRLDLRERAEAARRLDRVGDPRRGVGVVGNIPQIEWREVMPGDFIFGSDPLKDPDARENETPQHRIKLPTYFISTYPITVAQYEGFVRDNGYVNRDYWTEAGWRWKGTLTNPVDFWQEAKWHVANQPIIGITWYEALAYTRWLNDVMPSDTWPAPLAALIHDRGRKGKQFRAEGWKLRLPTEAEWEKAARGVNGILYTHAVRVRSLGQIAAVGIQPETASPYGVMDMTCNVRNWCLSIYSNPYRFPEHNRVDGEAARVIRGGSWTHSANHVRIAHRSQNTPYARLNDLGLRVVCAPDYR
jgi:formylglycine-generating enzyme required for sulfatase activity